MKIANLFKTSTKKVAAFKKKLKPIVSHWPKRSKELFFRLLIGLALLVMFIVLFYGLGIYRYHWSRYGTKTIVKIIPYPAAIVGPTIITVANLDYHQQFAAHFIQRTNASLDEQTLRKQTLEMLIEQRLVEIETKRYHLALSSEESEAGFRQIVQEVGGEEKVRRMWADLYGGTIEDMKQLLRERLLVSKFQREVFVSVHVAQILVKDENRAKEILKQLNAGADFAQLAKKFSEDANSREQGGDLGWLNRESLFNGQPLPQELEKAIFSLKPGEISKEPVKSGLGFYLFKVIEKRGQLDQSYQDWLKSKKEKTKIKIFID